MTAKSTAEVRRVEPTGIVCFRQADVGEYLREVKSHQDWDEHVDLWLTRRLIGGHSFHNDIASIGA